MKQSKLIQRDIVRIFKLSQQVIGYCGAYEFEGPISRNLAKAHHEIEKARDKMARLRNKAIDREIERSAP